jgi:hypothetical protein
VQQSAPTIYRIASAAIVAMFVVVMVQIAVFSISPPPTDPEGWLAVYARSPLLGFVNADGLYVLTNLLTFPLYVALWLRLRATAPTVAGAGLGVASLSLAVYLTTNVSVELGIVASHASGATGEAHTAAVGAVEALLARSMGTAFVAYYLLGAVALGLFGWALRATGVWGRTAATTAIASGILMLVPSTFGTLGLIASFASLIPYLWFCVIAVRRLRHDARIATTPAHVSSGPQALSDAVAGRRPTGDADSGY